MPVHPLTIAFTVAILLLSSFAHGTDGDKDQSDLSCQHYTDANTTAATCNDRTDRICKGGCTGFVTIDHCVDDKSGPTQDSPSTQNCTISYGRSSATMGICINEKSTFTCTGNSTGKATCKGCTMIPPPQDHHKGKPSDSNSKDNHSNPSSPTGNNPSANSNNVPNTPQTNNGTSAGTPPSNTNGGSQSGSNGNTPAQGSGGSLMSFNPVVFAIASLFSYTCL